MAALPEVGCHPIWRATLGEPVPSTCVHAAYFLASYRSRLVHTCPEVVNVSVEYTASTVKQ